MISRIVRHFLPKMASAKPVFEWMVQLECSVASRWVAVAHRRLMAVLYSIPPHPEHFDHHIDLYYQWRLYRNPVWLERGVYGNLALHGGSLLELSCGDGFNTRNFYSLRSKRVVACDFDPKAIKDAMRKNSAPNIDYVLADIRTGMPEGLFENIVWDAAIEHFTEDEIDGILKDIKLRLTENGILSGYTIVEKKDGTKYLDDHEYEFKNKEDLLRFFTPHFKHVTVFETIDPSRHNLYFWASNGTLPFRADWSAALTETSG